jgi:hypothetical protein
VRLVLPFVKAPHRAIMMGGFAGTGHVLGKHNIDQ